MRHEEIKEIVNQLKEKAPEFEEYKKLLDDENKLLGDLWENKISIKTCDQNLEKIRSKFEAFGFFTTNENIFADTLKECGLSNEYIQIVVAHEKSHYLKATHYNANNARAVVYNVTIVKGFFWGNTTLGFGYDVRPSIFWDFPKNATTKERMRMMKEIAEAPEDPSSHDLYQANEVEKHKLACVG